MIESNLGRKAKKTNYPMQKGDVKHTHADLKNLNKVTGSKQLNTKLKIGIKNSSNGTINIMINKPKLAVIGIGYVGLPLAISLANYFKVKAFDLNKRRILDLKRNYDVTGEFSSSEIKKAKFIEFTSNEKALTKTNIFFITVPTPINKKQPDLKNLIHATKLVARNLKKKSIVIYESTVFPGCTEEVCLPIIEKISKLKINKDFFLAYPLSE